MSKGKRAAIRKQRRRRAERRSDKQFAGWVGAMFAPFIREMDADLARFTGQTPGGGDRG